MNKKYFLRNLMITIIGSVLFWGTGLCAETVLLDRKIEDMDFYRTNQEPHYIAYDFPYAYDSVSALIAPIEREFQVTLKTRGEAHITLMTPPELSALKGKIPLSTIRELFEEKRAALSLSILCLGMGEVKIQDKMEKTFFLVVHSPELMEIRKEVARRAIQNGLEEGAFDPESFFPHITLGYTRQDLHIDQGVIKDERSCRKEITLIIKSR